MQIGEKLRTLRKSMNLSTAELANQISISQSYYSRFENNKAVPDIVLLSRILEALGTNMSDFFSDQSNELPSDLLQLIETAKKLTPEERKKVIDMLQTFLRRANSNELGGADEI
ncbi:XRE family transcriptional regulator [Brevibacillus laterosporus]|nr:helix-turn-helix transcriptional regulator [Brevibacillus laterosporus]TPG86841.1 XRE family transcriptional regulator [Brevibacillus laterosporus]